MLILLLNMMNSDVLMNMNDKENYDSNEKNKVSP